MKNETTNMIIENVKINKTIFVETYIHEVTRSQVPCRPT